MYKVGDRVIATSSQMTVFGEIPKWNGVITEIVRRNYINSLLYEVRKNPDSKEIIGNFWDSQMEFDKAYYRNEKLNDLGV